MLTLIVSDLHLGSPHCQHGRILTFLHQIPDGTRLILNGDTIDRNPDKLPPSHKLVLDTLSAASKRLEIIWLEGNHDLIAKSAAPPGPLLADFAIGHELYISHGHSFRLFRSYEAGLLPLIKFALRLAVVFGAPHMHPAAYAKRWPWLYRVLRERLRKNAIAYAHAHKFSTVTCGHIHFAEDCTEDGIRYINSGSWTEEDTYCIRILNDEISLIQNPDRGGFV
jgi:UDP-2,3-diacylglucosamine pyrophosphatase LpxH